MTSIITEFEGVDLGDKRRNRRLAKMAQKMEATASMSLPKIFSQAELEGAYRFLSNEHVAPEKILAAHFQKSAERVAAFQGDVIVAHDTTSVAFGKSMHRKGLGPLRNKSGQRGFFSHLSLAMTAKRRPLGVLSMTQWTREETRKTTSSQRESVRWRSHVTDCCERVHDDRKLIHVMDREADDYSLFASMLEQGGRFVIRSTHDRITELEEGERSNLKSQVDSAPYICSRLVPLSARHKGSRAPAAKKIHPDRKKRQATLEIRAMTVTVRHPRLQEKKRRASIPQPQLPKTTTLQVVRVEEHNAPVDQQPICWTLLSSEPIDSQEQVERIVDIYTARWTIEEMFKALKTGCQMERRQLASIHALENCWALFVPIAYQMLLLRVEAREDKPLPAADVLLPVQIKALRLCGRVKLPPRPNAKHALYAIAALGGYVKRKQPPGWLTILRGFEDLAKFVFVLNKVKM